MGWMGIGEVARQANIAASAIRYYEQIGLLPPCQRVSGKRRYEESILPKLAMIRLAQHAGYSIAEIHDLLHKFPAEATPSQRWNSLGNQKLAQLETLIQQALLMKATLEKTLGCQCASLEECAVEATDGLKVFC